MSRRILKADVKFISLCPKGANKLKTLYKEEKGKGSDTNFSADLLMKKADDMVEKGELYAVVYAPNMVDSQGDYATKEVIREAMHSAARNNFEIDTQHDGKALSKEDIYIAESFEILPNNPHFAGITDYEGNAVDVTGGWGVLFKIDNMELRKKYRDGEWQGVSMGGTYQTEATKSDDSQTVLSLLKSLLGMGKQTTNQPGDIEMTPQELNKAINDALDAREAKKAEADKLAKEEADKLAKKKAEESKGQPPEFKGDPNKPEDLAKHLKALEAYNLRKDVDWTDPESVSKYVEALKKSQEAEDGDEGGEGESEEDDAEARLKKQHEAELAKLRKASNLPKKGDKTAANMAKQYQEDLKLVEEMAKEANARLTPAAK